MHETSRPNRLRVKTPGAQRSTAKRQPGEPPRQWREDFAARLPFYPKTPEEHAARYAAATERLRQQTAEGRMGRLGVPDGWAGRGAELAAIRETAAAEAKTVAARMLEVGMVEPSDDPRAEEALGAVIAVVRAKDPATGQHLYRAKDRVRAAGIVLAFTKQPPVARADVSVQIAEAILAEVAADAGRDD